MAGKQAPKLNPISRNMLVCLLILMFGMLMVILRYGYLQLIDGANLAKKLDNQIQGESVLHVPRGAIYDTNMKELAISTMVSSLYIDPNHVVNGEQVAKKLAPLIGLKPEDVMEDINKGGGFVWVKRQLPYEQTIAVKKLMKDNPEYYAFLGFRQESKRFYPNELLAANVIGFVGTDDKGLAGIEDQFDSLIKGEQKDQSIFQDAFSRPILGSVFNLGKMNNLQGKSIQLTINAQYQFIVEKALDKAFEEHRPEAITAIVMDPKTGQILAMASRPTFDPNKYWKYPEETWGNRAISNIYEPGSVFKAIVAGAGFQEKVVKPSDTFDDPGVVDVSGHLIHNWNGGSFGHVTFTDVVKNSINTGFAMLGLKLGGERLMDYAKKFGFGKATGIELPGEAEGILFNPKKMVASDIATSAIGQSIAVTPLQMITAMSAIANDGVLLKPQIIKAIYNEDNSIYKKYDVQEVRRVLDPDVDKTLIAVLEQVVATGGGSKASIEGYHIAGKTGTAQKLDPVHGGYIPGSYMASFSGFGPVENPRFTVLVVINNPSKGGYYGGQIAAPIAHDIFLQLFRYADIKPVNGNHSLLDGMKKDIIHVTTPASAPVLKETTEDDEDSDE